MMKWTFLLKIVVSITIFFLVLWLIDWNEFGNTLKAANIYWIFLVFAIINIDRLFMAYKWMLLLRSSGISVSTGTAFKAYYVGSFWSSVLPFPGGDVVRIGWLTKNGHAGAIIASSVVIERLFGILALAIVASVSFVMLIVYLDLRLLILSRIIFFLLVVSIIAIMALFSRTVNDIVQKLMPRLFSGKALRLINEMKAETLAFKEKPGLLITFLVLSISGLAFSISSVFIMAKAFSIDLPLVWVVTGVPIILAIAKLPISISGLGLQEGAFAFIFSFAGVSLTGSVMMCLTDRVLMLLATLPGALWTASASKHNKGVPGMMTKKRIFNK
jgi:uncharacterized protein (TIRG00374 family)